MISFGFLTIRPQQEHQYATEIAKRAHTYGITCYRFTPFCIHPGDEQVHGEQYDHNINEWKEAVFPVPSFIYDRCFYKRDSISKKAKPIVNWLKTNPAVSFLGHGLPVKQDIYKVLSQHPALSAYVPKTEKIQSSQEVLQALSRNRKLLLKPDNGSQGRGIILLSIYRKQLIAQFQLGKELNEKVFADESSFHKWISQKIQQGPLLMQPFLNIAGYDHKPFDIRVLLQKNQNGTWEEAGRGIRKAERGHILTNVSHGAEIIPFEDGLRGYSSSQRKFICDEIESLLPAISQVMEQSFSPLFELGIDICIDNKGAIWVLDINSKPGRKVVLSISPEQEELLYNRPLAYCHFLARNILTV